MPEQVWNALVLYLGIGCVGSLVSGALWVAGGYKSSWVTNLVHVLVILIWPYLIFGNIEELEKTMKKAGDRAEKKRQGSDN